MSLPPVQLSRRTTIVTPSEYSLPCTDSSFSFLCISKFEFYLFFVDSKTIRNHIVCFSEDQEETNAADDMLSESFRDYEAGGYSPTYIPYTQLEPGTLVTQEDEDNQRLEYARQQVLSTGRKIQNVLTAEEQAMHREARKGMGSDEAQFSVESSLEAQIYLWSDKYRPRKPRYFNRVHTGFEWNKYNQTHYDMDNPPPKIVQGYKFNIFYPDLIDKNTTPEYFLVRYIDLYAKLLWSSRLALSI